MGLFKKNKSEKKVSDTPKNKKNSSEKKVKTPDVQIMMLGARRVGKTSMLASLYNSFSEISIGTNVAITKKGGKALDESSDRMKSYFKIPHMLYDEAKGIADNQQTTGFDIIDFHIEIAKNKDKYKVLRFIDCSGEWINNRQKEDEIGERIEQSDVVMIAIDTVLLMEKKGLYNGQNSMQAVTDFIIANMNPDNLCNSKKMVVFVPVKCEKYYHQHNDEQSSFYQKRMTEVSQRIKDEYKTLIGFLTSENNKPFFTVSILPVLTLGGIEFDEFTEEKKYNDILTDSMKYRYCEPDEYKPEHCEALVLYSLRFVINKIFDNYYKKAYNINKDKKKARAIVKEWFQDRFDLPKDVDFINELDRLSDKINHSVYPGFEIIQGADSVDLKKVLEKKG